MAKEGLVVKFDANTEAFQMRAQWKKVELCKKMWHDKWNWLLEERQNTLEASEAIRQKATDALPRMVSKLDTSKTLKPVPQTSTGTIGWISTRPDCQLEIYTTWITKIPVRLPDAWDSRDYHNQIKK